MRDGECVTNYLKLYLKPLGQLAVVGVAKLVMVVLFDFKKYKKIIKLIGSSQKEPSLVIFSLKLI